MTRIDWYATTRRPACPQRVRRRIGLTGESHRTHRSRRWWTVHWSSRRPTGRSVNTVRPLRSDFTYRNGRRFRHRCGTLHHCRPLKRLLRTQPHGTAFCPVRVGTGRTVTAGVSTASCQPAFSGAAAGVLPCVMWGQTSACVAREPGDRIVGENPVASTRRLFNG